MCMHINKLLSMYCVNKAKKFKSLVSGYPTALIFWGYSNFFECFWDVKDPKNIGDVTRNKVFFYFWPTNDK